jgi:undecaprenyl pyrophosphate phosphatase UppP
MFQVSIQFGAILAIVVVLEEILWF